MRILVCPDKFAGTLSASEAASAIGKGWVRFAPDAEVVQIPLSDGGMGLIDAIAASLNLKIEPVVVRGALGRPIPCEFAHDENTAYIEVAQVIGIQLVEPSESTSLIASSYGVGELIRHVALQGFRKIVIGLGGTSVSDAGAGLLAALGAKAFDQNGNQVAALENGASELVEVHRLDLRNVETFFAEVSVEILTDVNNPLLGSRGTAHIFAEQKGATENQIEQIENALTHFVSVIGKRKDGKNAAVALGAGAAGGIGFSLIHMGATRSAGIERVMEILNVKEQIAKADLVVTGEGKFDWQSLDGKVVSGVARAAMNKGKPTIVMAGQVEIGRRDWQTIGVAAAFSCQEFASLETSMAQTGEVLANLSERVARTWNR